MQKIFETCIRAYQMALSPDTGFLFGRRNRQACPFYPSCSEYAVLAMKKHGIWSGAARALWRIMRCHPWRQPAVDKP
ncbi:MAG: membrane protein insertion efficiency factor YidD [Parcubacteria group bacterium]|nr:membrane protein insertion efficiency factor YidD [Parcubacteria group bacterium]